MSQTDVTRYYLTNFEFDDNFDYTKAQSNDVAQEIREINGWIKNFDANYTISGIYEFGFKGQFNKAVVPATSSKGGTGGGLALSTGWGVNFTFYQNVTLPAGEYTLTVPTYNGYTATAGTSLLGWIPQSGSPVMSSVRNYPAKQWITDKITFKLTEPTSGRIQVGYKAGDGPSTNSANIILDYVKLEGKNMSTITEANAVDATGYIVNPSFEVGGTAGWKVAGMWTQGNNEFKQKSGGTYLESWVAAPNRVADCEASQKVKLPIGKYQLTVGAQNLLQSNLSKTCKGVYVFADGNEVEVGSSNQYSLVFINTTGEVEIGFKTKSAEGNWIAVDNFRLQYIGSLSENVMKQNLASLISSARSLYVSTKNGAETLNKAILDAQAVYDNNQTSIEEIQEAEVALNRAMMQFRLDNATPGTGLIAPKVTSTYDYVPTGATEALVRATIVGSNIMERGVCWSREHNPTVLDSRSTKSFSLNGDIFHIKGLNPGTVYYVRPYVMNTTYTVAYGEEIKIVTHPMGNCVGTWNEGAPTAEANDRCRNAIKETIDYFNEWTGIKGFTLTGNYGAQTPTADCSYGGWMRIGPNAGNQAIGTVIHETGHGVGVGTSARWSDKNVHNWKWYGREANKIYSFLENKDANPYTSDFCMVGDGSHGWGSSATFDWFVNGADKDKHTELQYIGGCCLLYGLFVDGLCPTTAYSNGIAGYTFNFDDAKKYYIMCKDAACGLGSGLLTQNGTNGVNWSAKSEFDDTSAWYLKYDAYSGNYSFVNVASGKYLSHSSSITLKTASAPTASEYFQFMPDRTDIEVNGKKTHGYWYTWNNSGDKSMSASATGSVSVANFDYADTATAQQWILISEDELADYNLRVKPAYIPGDANSDSSVTIIDLVETIDAVNGRPSARFNQKAADMDSNGTIDVIDIKAISDMLIRK